jgi:trimeric autotransporter adhesin
MVFSKSIAILAILAGFGSNFVASAQGCGYEAFQNRIGSSFAIFDDRSLVIHVHDDGTGPSLYAGGGFVQSTDPYFGLIAKWDGTDWMPLGSGLWDGNFPDVSALATYDDGRGDALYVGGSFTFAGDVVLNGIGRWDGVSWEPLGSGIRDFLPGIQALASYDDGSGSVLMAGGVLFVAGGVSVSNIAQWDGTTWASVGQGVDSPVLSLSVATSNGVEVLYAGTDTGVDRWDGANWSPVGGTFNGPVRAVKQVEFDGLNLLVAVGEFDSVDGRDTGCIVWFDGAQWATLGSKRYGLAWDVVVYDNGSGSSLYIGGWMHNPAFGVCFTEESTLVWNGQDWDYFEPLNDLVETMVVFDDGGGDALYLGGPFTRSAVTAGTLGHIVKWKNEGSLCTGSREADLHRDCLLNFFDWQIYLCLFEQRSPVVDSNKDGLVNFFDIAIYIDQYLKSCG